MPSKIAEDNTVRITDVLLIHLTRAMITSNGFAALTLTAELRPDMLEQVVNTANRLADIGKKEHVEFEAFVTKIAAHAGELVSTRKS